MRIIDNDDYILEIVVEASDVVDLKSEFACIGEVISALSIGSNDDEAAQQLRFQSPLVYDMVGVFKRLSAFRREACSTGVAIVVICKECEPPHVYSSTMTAGSKTVIHSKDHYV